MTLELNTVHEGDCLELMKEIPDKSVDLIVIDPPYNIGIKGEAWDKYAPEDYYAFMLGVFRECERVLKTNGSFYWFHNDMPQIARLMTDLNSDTSFIFNSFITWDKGDWRALSWKNPSEKSNLRSWFNTAEYCLLYNFKDDREFVIETQREYLFNEWKKSELKISDIKQLCGFTGNMPYHWFAPSLNDGKKSQWQLPTREHYTKLQNTGFWQMPYEELKYEHDGLKTDFQDLRFTHNLDANHKNVWQYKTENSGKFHACQKPLTVIERIIKTSSNEGDVVLDCFLGSGTTAIAAINTNRNYIGIEREPEYVAIARQRISDAMKTEVNG